MKKILFAALAATTLFASCAKEGNDGNKVAGEKAVLTVGVGSGTRAAGTLTDNSDNTIKCFKAFVFAGDRLQAIMTSATGAPVTEEDDVTTAANMVYVIANANTNSVLATVTPDVTNKAAFLALVGDLLTGSDALNILENDAVWASGSSALTFNTNNEATPTVAVVPVAARINVTVDDQRDNLGAQDAYELTKVQVLNVVGDAPFIAGTYTPTKWYSAYDGSHSSETVTSYLDNTYNSTGHLFYAFENDDSAYPTIVTLVVSNGTNTRYFPVHFTATDAECVLERGKSYQVVFTLTGDAMDDPGITDPEEEIVVATLTVTVTPTNWTLVDVEKEF